MSFIHDLTIGFLDPEAIARRKVIVLQPLTAEVRAVVEAAADRDTLSRVGDVVQFQLGGQPAQMTSEVAVVRWYAPVRGHSRVAASALAARCAALGCVVADIAHARVVGVAELEAAGAPKPVTAAGHHRLARQSGGIGFFAEVHVVVSEHADSAVTISADAFAWLKESYGPSARQPPDSHPLRSAAVHGARFALEHLASPRATHAVSITLIRFTHVDTTPECAAFASCRAVWDALGDPGAVRVELEGRQILFNGRPLELPNG